MEMSKLLRDEEGAAMWDGSAGVGESFLCPGTLIITMRLKFHGVQDRAKAEIQCLAR
jgi:hypothetical protein